MTEIEQLRAALRECASYIISPIRHSDDREEEKRRLAIYERAKTALSIRDQSGGAP